MLANVAVRFNVTGANPNSGSGTTDANGHASYTYTGNHPGTDTLSAYADVDGDNARDTGEPSATTSVTWTNASLTLTLSNATAQVGTTQSVTAHRTPEYGHRRSDDPLQGDRSKSDDGQRRHQRQRKSQLQL